jgi:hypothetical protein
MLIICVIRSRVGGEPTCVKQKVETKSNACSPSSQGNIQEMQVVEH